MLFHELRNARFFDVFEYNGVEQQWGCFLCNHPDRARGFVDVSTCSERSSLLYGKLKCCSRLWHCVSCLFNCQRLFYLYIYLFFMVIKDRPRAKQKDENVCKMLLLQIKQKEKPKKCHICYFFVLCMWISYKFCCHYLVSVLWRTIYVFLRRTHLSLKVSWRKRRASGRFSASGARDISPCQVLTSRTEELARWVWWNMWQQHLISWVTKHTDTGENYWLLSVMFWGKN